MIFVFTCDFSRFYEYIDVRRRKDPPPISDPTFVPIFVDPPHQLDLLVLHEGKFHRRLSVEIVPDRVFVHHEMFLKTSPSQ